MTCPPEIAPVLLEMIRTGILRIRAFGWSRQPERCALEADHIHNLPGLLEANSNDGLAYSWEVERPLYLDRCPEGPPPVWGQFWQELETHAGLTEPARKG